jgi:hypothetical protein
MADGRLSNRWWTDGASIVPGRDGGASLVAGENNTEGSLRLLGSMHLRNAFIEATIGPSSGNLWLYTSRTADHLARFGFTDAGYLHLQTWRGGRLTGERKMEWKRPDGSVRLRMEANGDGIMGYVDGRPAFGSRLHLPRDMGAGWLGVAVHSVERGRASADLLSLTAGAAPMRLGILAPTASASDADAQLAAVRQDVSQLTAICPAWFTIDNAGQWTASASDRQIYSVFARYHRLWLAPFVECKASSGVQPGDLEARALETGADGFILMFKEWPGDEWVASLRDRMRASSLRILVASAGKDGRVARALPVAQGNEFGNGTGDAMEVRIVRRSDLQGAEGVSSGTDPTMIGY